MKKQKFIFLFIVSLIRLHGQLVIDDDKAHRRYWYYRTRMVNDFIKIGKSQGDCIVFPQRNNLEDNSGTFEMESKIGPDQIDITNMYIMALALEYKILSRNNQDVSGTVKEIYHLLYTINRLDLEAEQFWDLPVPSSDIIQPNGLLNGFMLREDMPKSYMAQNLTHYNYALLETNYPNATPNPTNTYGGFTGVQHTNALTTDNKFSDFFSGAQPRSEMPLSQDKYHSMLVALMFVVKYIPSAVSYNGEAFQDGVVSIKAEAQEISKRIYSYCQSDPVVWSWKLKYIDSQGNSQGNLSNSVGGDAWMYSFALSRMVCHVNSPFPWSEYDAIASSCGNYIDANAQTIGLAEYKLQAFSPGLTQDAAVFKAWDAAGANAGVTIAFPLSFPPFLFMKIGTSAWSLEWMELLRKVLHQTDSLARPLSLYSDALGVAPCQGPFNYGQCDYGGYEWSSQDRLEHPDARGKSCNNNDGAFTGNYPGVDYMLLHNLYYEYQNQLVDGNQGNTSNIQPNIVTWIYHALTNVANAVQTAGCPFVQQFSYITGINTNLCNSSSGNGGGTVNNPVILSPYYGYNLMDNRDESVWPRSIGPNPTNIQGLNLTGKEGKVAVFQNLSSISHIYATSSPAAPLNTTPSNVSYRAGKEISLDPGFEVDAGSTFYARIERYICADKNDNLPMRPSNNPAGEPESVNLNYENDPINPVPLHYVVSPKSDADNNPVVFAINHNDMEVKTRNDLTECVIMPNPSTGYVSINTKRIDAKEKITLQVYDMKGLLFISLTDISSKQEVNLEGYSDGIYVFQITSDFGKNIIKKITIIK